MNPFTSLAGPIEREEEMDAAELSPARYAKVLADLSRVNALTLARRMDDTIALSKRHVERTAEIILEQAQATDSSALVIS